MKSVDSLYQYNKNMETNNESSNLNFIGANGEEVNEMNTFLDKYLVLFH